MSRLTRIRHLGSFQDLGSARAVLRESGDLALVVRGQPRWLVMRCPEGCGEDLSINLDARSGKAWRLDRRNGLSVFPSIWRESGCEAHFIIWRNEIWWDFGWDQVTVSPELKNRIVTLLTDRGGNRLDSLSVALALDEEPWAVLIACDLLFREGLVKRSGSQGNYLFWVEESTA
jgi:hypothetical protein